MGQELWTSPITGYRRRGTRLFEIRALFAAGVQARAILEPLQCCPANVPAIEIRELLDQRGFDVTGVQDSPDGPVLGYVETSQLQNGIASDHLIQLRSEDVLSDSTPLSDVLSGLRVRQWFFVVVGVGVKGIITRADLNKPPVRIYVFSLISLLEMHLRYWVRASYPEDQWQQEIKSNRLEAAKKLQEERRARNSQITLLACLQFADLRDLIIDRTDLRAKLLLGSKSKAKSLLRDAEGLRNSLAHSQADLIEGSTWEELIDLVTALEFVVAHSDQQIEDGSQPGVSGPSLWVVRTE
jgi:hypothetical protein